MKAKLRVEADGSLPKNDGYATDGNFHVFVKLDGTITTGNRDEKNWIVEKKNKNPLHAVAYGEGLWVAVGEKGTIITSPDAIRWNRMYCKKNAHLVGIHRFPTGLWVAVGDKNEIIISKDGSVWE